MNIYGLSDIHRTHKQYWISRVNASWTVPSERAVKRQKEENLFIELVKLWILREFICLLRPRNGWLHLRVDWAGHYRWCGICIRNCPLSSEMFWNGNTLLSIKLLGGQDRSALFCLQPHTLVHANRHKFPCRNRREVALHAIGQYCDRAS